MEKAPYNYQKHIGLAAIFLSMVVAVLLSNLFHRNKDDDSIDPLTKKELTSILSSPLDGMNVRYTVGKREGCHCQFVAEGSVTSDEKVLTKFAIFVYKGDGNMGDGYRYIPKKLRRHEIYQDESHTNYVFLLDRDVTLSFSAQLSGKYYQFIDVIKRRLDANAFTKYEFG